MPGVSIHIVDVARGRVAEGMRVALYALGDDDQARLVAEGQTSRRGLFEDSALDATFPAGRYRAVFHVGAYYRAQTVPLPDVPFLDVVTYDFGIADSAQHYHLPFKCTPWGYSCFRGGA
jgi:5-hydroxyisourate hydrolase